MIIKKVYLLSPRLAFFRNAIKNHRLAIPTNKEFSIPQLKFMIIEIEQILGKSISASEWNDL